MTCAAYGASRDIASSLVLPPPLRDIEASILRRLDAGRAGRALYAAGFFVELPACRYRHGPLCALSRNGLGHSLKHWLTRFDARCSGVCRRLKSHRRRVFTYRPRPPRAGVDIAFVPSSIDRLVMRRGVTMTPARLRAIFRLIMPIEICRGESRCQAEQLSRAVYLPLGRWPMRLSIRRAA